MKSTINITRWTLSISCIMLVVAMLIDSFRPFALGWVFSTCLIGAIDMHRMLKNASK